MNIGGDRLTAAVSESMDISYAEAEGIRSAWPGRCSPRFESVIARWAANCAPRLISLNINKTAPVRWEY